MSFSFGRLSLCRAPEVVRSWQTLRVEIILWKGKPSENSLYSRVSFFFVETTCSQILLGLFFKWNPHREFHATFTKRCLSMPGVLNPASNGCVTEKNSLTNGVADVTMDVLGEILAVKSTYSLTMPGSWHLL